MLIVDNERRLVDANPAAAEILAGDPSPHAEPIAEGEQAGVRYALYEAPRR